jgi:two-component system CheB/CheR fusion protein
MAREHRFQEQLGLEEQRRTELAGQVDQLTRVNRELLESNEELSTENAELRSVNEELLVANEEAQAATEEVETLNEELQATNEELETLNEELQATVEELNTTNDDLQARSVELQDLAVSLEDQRRASDAERTQLQSVLAALPDAVALLGRHGTPILTNAAYDHLFGSSPDSMGLEDDSGQPLAADNEPRRRAASGEVFSLRFVARLPDGTRKRLAARASPIDTEDAGRCAGLLVIRELSDGES